MYLVEDPIIETSPTLSNTGMKIEGYCERPPQWRDHLHILNGLNQSTSLNRKRREEQTVDNGADPKNPSIVVPTPPSPVTRTLTLTCDPLYKNIRCYPIYCHINGIAVQHYYNIKLRARLWNSTLIENYYQSYDRVDIQSYAFITINDLLIVQSSINNDNTTVKIDFEYRMNSIICFCFIQGNNTGRICQSNRSVLYSTFATLGASCWCYGWSYSSHFHCHCLLFGKLINLNTKNYDFLFCLNIYFTNKSNQIPHI